MGDDSYLAHREVTERALRSVIVRLRLTGADAEDFAQDARLELLRKNKIFGSFQRRASLLTFLFKVFLRFGINWHHTRYGRWRPSALARRLGGEAIALERLTARDGFSEDEAVEGLATAGSKAGKDELSRVAAQLKTQLIRKRLAELVPTDSGWTAPDVSLSESVLAATAARVARALNAARKCLDPEERRLRDLRFYQGATIRQIADELGAPRREMYGRFEKLLQKLRCRLTSDGVSREDALSILGRLDPPQGRSGAFMS